MRIYGPILRGLNMPWKAVLHRATHRNYLKGQIIYNAGDEVNGLHFIESGMVIATSVNTEGVEHHVFHFKENTLFGLSPLFNKGAADTVFYSATPTVCHFFPRDIVYGDLTQENPHLLLNLLESFAYQSRAFGRFITDRSLKTPYTRVALLLLSLVTEGGTVIEELPEGVAVRPDLTHEMLARLLGMHRVTVTKIIGELREKGIIGHFSKVRLEILDLEKLMRAAC